MVDCHVRRAGLPSDLRDKMATDDVKAGKQKAAEDIVDGFRRALGPFVVAAETTRMPMMFTDATSSRHPVIFVNQAFLDLTGYDEHEVMGEGFYSLMERGTDPEMLAEIRTSFGGARGLEPVVRYSRKDDSAIWVQIHISPVRTGEGDVAQHFISFVDVTRHKEEEARLVKLLADRRGRT